MKLFANEKAFHRWVLAEARKRGWRGFHPEAHQIVRRPEGPIAVASKDATGFPDLVLWHPEHGLVFAECKMPHHGRKRELRPEQLEWITCLRSTGERVYIWHPHEQDEVLAVLDGTPIESRLFDTGGVIA